MVSQYSYYIEYGKQSSIIHCQGDCIKVTSPIVPVSFVLSSKNAAVRPLLKGSVCVLGSQGPTQTGLSL